MIISQYLRTTKNSYIFSLFINIRSHIKQSGLRCKYIAKYKIYEVKINSEKKYASVNSRVLTYLSGFSQRANYIANTYMLNLIDFRAGDLVVDCGANMGDLEYFLRRNLPKVDYIGYEPNPHDFSCLVRNVGISKCRNIGLWNVIGSIPFYVNDDHSSSSFIEPPEFRKIIKIPASTLNCEFPTTKIRLLKLEAEGAEPEVLQGASEILHNIDYISADVGPERGIDEEETRDFVVNFLIESGFELVNESSNHRKVVLLKRKAPVVNL